MRLLIILIVFTVTHCQPTSYVDVRDLTDYFWKFYNNLGYMGLYTFGAGGTMISIQNNVSVAGRLLAAKEEMRRRLLVVNANSGPDLYVNPNNAGPAPNPNNLGQTQGSGDLTGPGPVTDNTNPNPETVTYVPFNPMRALAYSFIPYPFKLVYYNNAANAILICSKAMRDFYGKWRFSCAEQVIPFGPRIYMEQLI